MPTIDEYTRSQIPRYACARISQEIKPAIHLKTDSISFGGRMLCSSCLSGKCSQADPPTSCEPMTLAEADTEAWARLNFIYEQQRQQNPVLQRVDGP